ncbi:YcbK family protein [Consotaella salsifontis]|uniref:Uncharacterized conserved protein YcbK, DUF882 family n=1 Tax=Consotaella salsifontis TaxID=1365950 RepID=A0A1T4L6B2_9HYPH|nr:D-Ala-D-Ala carboxypeptidase family metallohydrolase [Consotaella salsifontis]SJZ50100.1 Uncharacterized conserved protein YcbK, DUF882 family [Consotaella salsifontis]
MTSDIGRTRRPALVTLAAATALASLSFVAGCVSSADDSSSLGFANTTTAASAGASASAEAKEGDAPTADASVPSDAETTVVADAAPASSEMAAKTPSDDAGASKPADAATLIRQTAKEAAGQVSLAAYAPSAQKAQPLLREASAETSQADRTFYASLFSESQAKVPIRNTDNSKSSRVIVPRSGAPVPAGDAGALPGVDPDSLFEIGHRASADDEDMIEDVEQGYQVASVTGLARLAPNGLMVQREDVETSCFPAKLVSMVRAVEQHFGQKAVITSGYRSPSHNRAVNGAKKSMHMLCQAADIQVPGANSRAVAEFVRALPGRGGVGTYCHTTAVHIDIGRQRDWNWQCRRRSSPTTLIARAKD